MANRFAALAAPGVQKLQPYQPGKPTSELEREYGVSHIIKLASNENPLGPSPKSMAAMREALDEVALYPDANGYALKRALAEKHGVDFEQITLGNGSNDVLVLLAQAFLTREDEAVFSEHAFAVYPIAVQISGATAQVAPALGRETPMPLGHDLDAMRARLSDKTKLVFVANPNNPTGTWVDGAALREFVAAVPEHALVVVDEAYFEYVEDPEHPDCSQWLAEFPNLVVTRTFSKAYGLAGVRMGYMLSHPDVADIVNRVRPAFNTSHLAQVAAQAALEDEAHLQRSRELNAAGMRELQDGLDDLGLWYAPSACNFLLVDLEREAAPLFDALLREGVIVRPMGGYGLPSCVRISIGREEDNRRLLDALGKVLG